MIVFSYLFLFRILIISDIGFTLSGHDFASMPLNSFREDSTFSISHSEDNAIRGSSAIFSKPEASTTLLKGKRGTYGIWIDETKWKIADDHEKKNTNTEFEFIHANGGAYGLLYYERTKIAPDSLELIVLNDEKLPVTDTKIIHEEKRQVNDTEILCIWIEGMLENIPVVCYNYIYAGNAGVIRYIAYSPANEIYKYQPDFEDLLNGLEVYLK